MTKIDDLKTAVKKINDAISAINKLMTTDDDIKQSEFVKNELYYITNCLEFVNDDLSEIIISKNPKRRYNK